MFELEKAMQWAKNNHPDASLQHKAAFANSVAYLVTGYSGGFGGPSLREHLVSWSLAGPDGAIGCEAGMTVLHPDGSLPRPGNWDFESACQFAAPLCFGPTSDSRSRLIQIMEREHHFDDDPVDLQELRGKSV